MEEYEKNRAEERRQTRRAWWLMAGLVGLALGVLAWVHLFYDGPAPDDQALLPHFSAPAGDNPLKVFFESASADLDEKWSKLSDEAKQGKAEAKAEILQFVEGMPDVYLAFDSLMASDLRSWRWPMGAQVCEALAKSDYSYAVSVGQAVKMKIHSLNLAGDHIGAAKLSLLLARYGLGLQGAQGSVMHSLVAFTLNRMGEEALKNALRMGNPSPEFIQECLRTLETMESPTREQFQFVCQADYLYFKNMMGYMKDNHVTPSSFRMAGAPPSFKERVLGLFLKQNQTLQQRVKLDLPVLEGLQRSWAAGLAEEKRAAEYYERTSHKRQKPRAYLNPNFEGDEFLAVVGGVRSSILERAIATVVLHRQTCLMLALRLFELEHGKLPQRLEELVPGYLREVPEDVFVGGPMRWNATSGVVYSVGKNETDDGGVLSAENSRKSADLGMRYWWGPAKEEVPEAP